MHILKSQFPHSHIKNILLFYALTFLSQLFFIVGNWLFFWIRFMTYGELGFLDMFAFSFGFFMEIPTGAIADKIGHKKSVVAAFLLSSLGFFMIALGNSQLPLIIGFFIAQIGWAFYSGAAEAMAYDSLKEEKLEDDFQKVITTSQFIGKIALITGGIAGGLLFTVNFRFPHLFTAIAFGIGFVVSLFLHQPAYESKKFSARQYLKQMKDGFLQLGLPAIRPFLPLIIITAGVGFMYGTGTIQPALGQQFGYNATTFSILSSVGIFIGAIAIKYIPWMRTHLTDKQGLYLLAVLFTVAFMAAALPLNIYVGGALLLIFSIVRSLSDPWISIVVNRELSSEYRATALSGISMLTKIPYIATAAITGILIDAKLLPQLCLVIGGCIALVVLFHMLFARKSASTQDN